MYANKKILAVVPARGGSKGIPLKNLRTIAGRPMVALVGDVVRQIPEIDKAVVSTDHEKIKAVAELSGLDAPFMRPEEIAGDRVGDLEVLTHALEECERIDGVQYDVIVMLQPTSPLRKTEHVTGTIAKLLDGGWDSVWTVSETDSKGHPLKQLTVSDDGSLGYYDEAGKKIIARQQLKPVYHRNGIAYAITRECLLEQKSIMGRNGAALVLDGDFVSIDTEWDIDLVEFFMQRSGFS